MQERRERETEKQERWAKVKILKETLPSPRFQLSVKKIKCFTLFEDGGKLGQSFQSDVLLRVFVVGHGDDPLPGLDIDGLDLVLEPAGVVGLGPVVLGPVMKAENVRLGKFEFDEWGFKVRLGKVRIG
jgi:hypothetical protein